VIAPLVEAAIIKLAVTERLERLVAIQDRWDGLREAKACFAREDYEAAMKTGVVTKKYRQFGGPNGRTVEEYEINTALIEALNSVEKRAAIETGQEIDRQAIRPRGGLEDKAAVLQKAFTLDELEVISQVYGKGGSTDLRGRKLVRVHLILKVVDDKKQTAVLRGRGGMILVRAPGGIIAGREHVVFKNQIAFQHIAVFEARMMMRGIVRAGHHADQRCKFAANRILVKPGHGHARERRWLPVHPIAAGQSDYAARKHSLLEDTLSQSSGRGGSWNRPGKVDCQAAGFTHFGRAERARTQVLLERA